MKILRLVGILILIGALATAGALQQKSKLLFSYGPSKITSQSTKTAPDGSIIHVTTMVGQVKEIHWAPTALFGGLVLLGAGLVFYARAQENRRRRVEKKERIGRSSKA
jgi:hypothetical protein